MVPQAELAAATQSMALELANGPTIALGRTKRLINESLNRNLAEQLQAEQDRFAACALTQDLARGVRGFVAKQKPGFLGN